MANKGRSHVAHNKGKKNSPETRAKIKEALKNAPLKRCKVKCIEENLIFNSITDAALWCNGNTGHICQCCKGQRKRASGYHWQYIY